MSHLNDLHCRYKIVERLKYLRWVDHVDIDGLNEQGEHVTLRFYPNKTAVVFFPEFCEEYSLENLPKLYMDWLLERTLLECEREAAAEVRLEEQRELERVRQHKVIAKLREKNLL